MEGAALVGDAVEPDAAAVGLDEAAADREADSGSAGATGHRAVDAIEAIEDALGVLGRDADAVIADAEGDRAAVGGGVEDDPAGVRRVLDGVLDQVAQHLLD